MKRLNLMLFIFIAFLSVSLSGCAFYSAPRKVKVKIPVTLKYNINKTGKINKNSPGKKYAKGGKWWRSFNSAGLDALVKKGLSNNINYKIAVKNIQVAKTYISQNESGLFPSVNLSYSFTRSKLPGYETSIFSSGSSSSSGSVVYNLHQLGLSASYEVDLWHKIFNSVNQANENFLVSKEDAGVVKLTLISNIVYTYFQICYTNAEIHNLKSRYRVQNKILRLESVLYKEGIQDEGPVLQAKSALEVLKIQINGLQRLKGVLLNTIAYYVGEYPEDFNFNFKYSKLSNLDFKQLVPSFIPSKVLLQRPDVKAAEYNVLSYAYARKESLANFFPSIALTGNYGFASVSLDNLVSDASNVWDFGLSALVSVFNYKQNESIYKRSGLQYSQAVLNYRETVLNAFGETDSALVSYKKDYSSLINYKKTYLYSYKIYKLNRDKFKAEIESKPDFMGYRLNLLEARYNLLNQNFVMIGDIINIYNALGVGL